MSAETEAEQAMAATPGLARMARLAAHADRAMALSGWRIREAAVNLHTGFVRLAFLRREDRAGRLVTVLRSTWGAKVVTIREDGVLKPGMHRDFWDFSESTALGRDTREGLRSALRSVAIYVGDNPAAGQLGSGKEPFLLLAGALIECGAA